MDLKTERTNRGRFDHRNNFSKRKQDLARRREQERRKCRKNTKGILKVPLRWFEYPRNANYDGLNNAIRMAYNANRDRYASYPDENDKNPPACRTICAIDALQEIHNFIFDNRIGIKSAIQLVFESLATFGSPLDQENVPALIGKVTSLFEGTGQIDTIRYQNIRIKICVLYEVTRTSRKRSGMVHTSSFQHYYATPRN